MFTTNLFTNVEAFAGKTTIEDKGLFQIPNTNDALVAFEIQTNCLSPTLLKGDMVICKNIDDVNTIIDHQIYAILIENKAYVRRIRRILDKKGRITHLQLYTNNSNELQFSTIHISQVGKIFRVANKMSSLQY
jgi:phage repressor protein C with HTH and peptisase S24 domain